MFKENHSVQDRLIKAISKGKFENVRSLVKYHSASLSLPNSEGKYPLVAAVHGVHIEIAQWIEEQLSESACLKQWEMVDFPVIKEKIISIFPEKFTDLSKYSTTSPSRLSNHNVSSVHIWTLADWYKQYKDAPWRLAYEDHQRK